MELSIIHPSRSRPHQALDTCHRWLTNLSGSYTWEYILSVDESDPKLSEYRGLFDPISMCINDNNNLVQAANKAVAKSTGKIIILISDDFFCYKNWDVDIVSALKSRSGVLKTFDGVQKWICTLPCMTRDYYDAQGYFYDPGTIHMFSDTLMTHKADLEGKLIVRNDIVFRHNHYSLFKGQPKDAVNEKADSTWGQGEKVYLQWCRDRMKEGKNIFNIQGHSHRNWLKQKLRAR